MTTNYQKGLFYQYGWLIVRVQQLLDGLVIFLLVSILCIMAFPFAPSISCWRPSPKAAQAAFSGRPFNPAWSESAKRVYEGLIHALPALPDETVVTPNAERLRRRISFSY